MCFETIPLIFLIMGLTLALVLGLVLPRMAKKEDIRQMVITLALVMAIFTVMVYLLNCIFNLTPPTALPATSFLVKSIVFCI
jgi:low affinity Fe/Cu permease